MERHTYHKLCKARVLSLPGQIFPTNYSGNIKIIEYTDANNVIVEFLRSGARKKTTWWYIKNGEVRYRAMPRFNNYGKPFIIGYGEYKPVTHIEAYTAWTSMIKRRYNPNRLTRNPTYNGCKITEEWLNFQNFARWFMSQVRGNAYQLDKDILCKHNKVYGPQYCCLVPAQINSLFIKCNRSRGKYPLGVSRHKDFEVNPYVAVCNDGNGKSCHLGCFRSQEEAFIAYKLFKESVIKQKAELYKDVIEPRVYDALMKYEVEITD
jgi:hypothetical protein